MRRREFLMGATVLTAGARTVLSSDPGFAQTPQRGGTLRVVLHPEPSTLVLALNQFVPTLVVAGKIYQSLLTFDFGLKPEPSLATSWSRSADGLVYTFKLRENVRWHDGKPFTSADVIFSTQVLLPEVHPRARANFARVASVAAPNDLTVVYTLKEPFGPFLHCFEVSSAPVLPKHIYEGTDFRANPANATPIGTGPFKFLRWVRGSSIELVRNDDYHDRSRPYLDAITFVLIPDAATRALAIETGQVQQSQFDSIEPFEVERLSKLPQLAVTTKGYEFLSPVLWLDINNRVAPLNDKRVRQALLTAIDRDFILKNLFFNLGKVATGPIASTTKFYDGGVSGHAFNLARANSLLDEAGLKPGADGVRFRVKGLVLPYGEVFVRLAEYTRQAFRRIGVDLVLETTDTAGLVKRTSEWDYELTWSYLSQFADPALGVSRTYISTNIRKGVPNTNVMGYNNPEVDRLFEEAAKATKDEDRQRHYSQVQKILVDDVPVAWLIEMAWPTFVNRKVHEVVTTGLGVVESYDRVWIS